MKPALTETGGSRNIEDAELEKIYLQVVVNGTKPIRL